MPARGPKPNSNPPPSRLLTQQRQHRARKAQLVQDLEQRCRTLEEENAQLRRELDTLAGRSCEEPSPQLMEVSSEVMRNMVDAAASMTRWQQVARVRSPSQGQDVPRSVDGSRSGLPMADINPNPNPNPNPTPPTSASASAISHHPEAMRCTPSATAPTYEPSSTSTSCTPSTCRPRPELTNVFPSQPSPPFTSPPSSSSTTLSPFGSFSLATTESFERGRSGSRGSGRSTTSTANTTRIS